MTEPAPGGATSDIAPSEPDAPEPAGDIRSMGGDPPRRSRQSASAAAWLGLLLVIAAAVLIGPSVENEVIALANPDGAAADGVRAAFADLGPSSLVLVAMDADLGTYPEIRGTTAMALQDLLRRGASVAFVSTSVEGRALAVAELERLRQAGVASGRLLDLGFVTGAEAGMVRLVDGALRPGMTGPIAALMAQRHGGIGAFDLILVVGGTDIGPRSWVEQVGTRLPTMPMVAIAPTFARPELAPYLRTGQLDGLLATVRDDARYVQATDENAVTGVVPSAFALRIGMLIGLIVVLRQLADVLPRLRGGLPGPGAVEE